MSLLEKSFLRKLNINLPHDLALPLLGTHPKEMKPAHQSDNACILTYCDTLHNSWVLQSTDKWLKRMWYTHTMQCYSAIMKNGILSFTAKWMEPEDTILSEIRQTQKAQILCILFHMEVKNHQPEHRLVINRDWKRCEGVGGEGIKEICCLGSFLGMKWNYRRLQGRCITHFHSALGWGHRCPKLRLSISWIPP